MADDQNKELVDDILREMAQAESNRGNWDSHWEQVARLVWPAQAGFFSSRDNTTPGQRKGQDVYDSTAPIGLTRFAAVMESMNTPRNSKWHRLGALNQDAMKDRGVRLWFEQLTELLFHYRYSSKANFQGQTHQFYLGQGAYGTSGLFVDQAQDEPGLRYKNIHLGELYTYENHQGVIDKFCRRFKLTARQAFGQFGVDILPPKIKAALTTPDGREHKFEFVHCVRPRQDYDYRRIDNLGKKWASYYVAREDRVLLREGGYTTFPLACARHSQAPGEEYGRSPAMEALPAIKTLNEEKKIILRSGHRALDPVLLAHDDGVLDHVSLKNGAVNWGGVNADGRPLIHALPTGDIRVGEELMKLEVAAINDVFLVTLFQILTETPEMTATEVIERIREKGILLAPAMGRLQSEFLGPLIERELDVLFRQGLIPPMPPLLQEAGGQYKIEYDSPLSRAARAEEASGLLRSIEVALNIAERTQNSEPLDYYNWDVITPEINRINGTPERWMNSAQRVAEIRQGRAQAQQQQQAVDAAPAAASVVKTLSTVKGGAPSIAPAAAIPLR